MTEQKRIYQLHEMGVEEARQFQRVLKNDDDLILSDHYDVTVVKKESIDVVHIWKRKK